MGFLYGIISFLLFSIVNASNRYVSFFNLYDISSWILYKNLFSLIILITFGIIIYKKYFFIYGNKKAVWLRAFIIAINQIFAVLSVKYLPLDVFYSITFLMPILISAMGIWLLKEKYTFGSIWAIFLGLVGSIVVIQPNISNMENLLGVLFAFIVVISGSVSAIIVKKYLPNENTFASMVPMYLLSTLVICATSYGEINNIQINWEISLFSLCISIVGILASVLFMKAYQASKTTLVAPTQYTQMIWGSLFGYILFNNIPSINTIIGCFVIIFANYINMYYNQLKIRN